MFKTITVLALAAMAASPALAQQQTQGMDHSKMQGMNHDNMPGMNTPPAFIFVAVFAAFAKSCALGAPLSPFFLILRPDFLFLCIFAYRLIKVSLVFSYSLTHFLFSF